MYKAMDLHFDFKNITHYLHPVLLHNISRWREIDGTFIIKKYNGESIKYKYHRGRI